MTVDIAVYVNGNGETASLYDQGKIVVYRKKSGQWSILREREFILDNCMGIKVLREKMAEVLEFLNGCRVYAGLSVAGLPYYELEKAGYSVWELDGNPLEFLDSILAAEEERHENSKNSEKNNAKPAPVEISNGYYRISIKEIQENNTGVTSKQALLPFLRRGDFNALEILCNHVPPWLQAELVCGGYSGEIEKNDSNEVKIILSKVVASQSTNSS